VHTELQITIPPPFCRKVNDAILNERLKEFAAEENFGGITYVWVLPPKKSIP
jgi:hypothetical protein